MTLQSPCLWYGCCIAKCSRRTGRCSQTIPDSSLNSGTGIPALGRTLPVDVAWSTIQCFQCYEHKTRSLCNMQYHNTITINDSITLGIRECADVMMIIPDSADVAL